MFESMMVITSYLLVVLTPVLIPAMIHAAHTVCDWRRPGARAAAASRSPRPTTARRLAVAAA